MAANTQTTSTFTYDQGKYIADKLIARTTLLHRMPQMCESRPLPQGMGTTANFIEYARTDIPMAPLTEGTTPDGTAMTVNTKTVTVDQYGMYFTLSDVAELTTKHDVLNQAINLLGDAIARVTDWTIADVFLANTNSQFWDGSRANRGAVTSSDVFKKEVFAKAASTLRNNGANPRIQGDFFAAVLGPNVEQDILVETSGSTFTGYSLLQAYARKAEPVEKGAVGAYFGFMIIRTNFIPKFTRLTYGGTVTEDASAGSLTGTVYYKVVRRSTQRGFSEDIQVITSVAMSSNTEINFAHPSTSGYVYDVYLGASNADASMYRVVQGAVAGSTSVVGTMPTSGVNPPATPGSGVTVHPIFCVSEETADWVPLDGSSMKGMITPKTATDSDPLSQRRKVGSKYMAKAGIRRSTNLLTIELASNF